MRFVATFDKEKEAYRLHIFLKREGIDNFFDPALDPKTKRACYTIWVLNDDDQPAAIAIFKEFQADPQNSRYALVEKEIRNDSEEMPLSKRFFRRPYLTLAIIALCCFLFMWDMGQRLRYAPIVQEEPLTLLTPLEGTLFYDYPEAFQKMTQFWEGLDTTQKDFKLTPQQTSELAALQKIPYWKGLYDLILHWPPSKEALSQPLFVKIREGEIYRLVTPVLLHGNILHILFNLLWVWLLGRMIEERVSRVRYFALMVVTAIVSNTIQYLMAGPAFLGYSGVITGLAGFIWVRQRVAPWEGYPLERLTSLFLGLYIFGMLAVQLALFVLDRYTSFHFNLPIANAAHIAGALCGMVLARCPLFYKELG